MCMSACVFDSESVYRSECIWEREEGLEVVRKKIEGMIK